MGELTIEMVRKFVRNGTNTDLIIKFIDWQDKSLKKRKKIIDMLSKEKPVEKPKGDKVYCYECNLLINGTD